LKPIAVKLETQIVSMFMKTPRDADAAKHLKRGIFTILGSVKM